MPYTKVTGPFPVEKLLELGVEVDDMCQAAAAIFNAIGELSRRHNWGNGQVLPAVGVALALFLKDAPEDAREWLSRCCFASVEDFEVVYGPAGSQRKH